MAKNDELELDTAGKSGGKGKLIILIVVVVLLVAGAVVGTLFFTGNLGGGGDDDGGKKAKKAKADEPKELTVKPASYLDLAPPFVVNFEDQTHAGYLQIEMQAMTYDPEVGKHVTKHMPLIRNNILLLLSAQKYEVMRTREGKETLQKEILEMFQKIIKDTTAELKEGETAPTGTIEKVYFTSFIMQ